MDEREFVKQLDDVECQAIIIMADSMIEGDTDEEAAEKAAAFLLSQGREGQAWAVCNTTKTFE